MQRRFGADADDSLGVIVRVGDARTVGPVVVVVVPGGVTGPTATRHERLARAEVRFEVRVIGIDPGVDDRDIRARSSDAVGVSDLGVHPVDSPGEDLGGVAATTATPRWTAAVIGIVVDGAHRSVLFDVPDVVALPEVRNRSIRKAAGDRLPDRAEVEDPPDRLARRRASRVASAVLVPTMRFGGRPAA